MKKEKGNQAPNKMKNLNFIKVLSILCVILAWWNGILSVFDMETLFGRNLESQAFVLFVFVTVSGLLSTLLAMAFRIRNIRFAANVMILLPFIAAACARVFPPAKASWLLVAAFVFYLSCCAMERCESKMMLRSIVPIAVVFIIMACISFSVGRQIDHVRKEKNGYYQNTRLKIKEHVIGTVEELIEKMKRQSSGKEEEDNRRREEEKRREREEKEEQDRLREEEDPKSEEKEQVVFESDGTMEDLKSLAAFKPSSETSTCAVLEKPTETIYIHDRIGVTYEDSSWTNESLNEMITSSEYHSEEEKFAVFLQYPKDQIERMEQLCADWDKSSLLAVNRQIDEILSDMVYDVRPGSTPEKWDFAEYFLLENKKGFCVHFATTAALFYRMCGYPAIYVEGWAVPASAFEEKENGIYEARVDGSMGHAWCEVYDKTSGQWITMDHTSAASGNSGQDEELSEGETKSRSQSRFLKETTRKMIRQIFFVSLVIGIMWAAVLLQASIRGKRHRGKIRILKEGKGILVMYEEIVRIARLVERTEKQELYSETQVERLKEQYPEISNEEWDHLYEQVRRILFYYPEENRETWMEVYEVYRRFLFEAKKRMDWKKRMIYKYIYCETVKLN